MSANNTHVEAFRDAVLAALGAAPESIEPGKLYSFSLNGKRSDTAGWCQLFLDGRAGVFGDFRAGMSSVWTERRREGMTAVELARLQRQAAAAKAERLAQQRAAWAAQAPKIAELWSACRPVPADGSGDDPVSRYLHHRLAFPDHEPLHVPATLRWHPALEYWHDGKPAGRWPALVARVESPDGKLVALHRTWLTGDGRKAPVPGPVKKLSAGAGQVMGGCIPLGFPDASGRIGVAEGIETALAARCASSVPVVAAYSAGALAAWCWPPGARRLLVFADNDQAGADAAEKLRQRARASGLWVAVLAPTTPGADWCDVWADRNAKQAAE